MTRFPARARSGITLTEILISIMILGIGVVSLATLFPLGLIRLRNAQRLSRGATLVETAIADLGARNLLAKASFYPSPRYQTAVSGFYDPWVQDTAAFGADWGTPIRGAFRSYGPGLPVAYDPLWRHEALGLVASATIEGRFGSGIGLDLSNDPNDGGPPSAHGLHRIANLGAYFAPVYPPSTNFLNEQSIIRQTFISPEDVIFQEASGTYVDFNNNRLLKPSTVSPDLNMDMVNFKAGVPVPTNDWRFTWFVTGQQSDALDGMIFDADIVVCENRPLAIDNFINSSGTSVAVPSGETVMEAIWGYTSTPRLPLIVPASNIGYGGVSGLRTVVVRWPNTRPDPAVKVGQFIADVTYERNSVIEQNRYAGSIYPAQRCYWYQIARRTEPSDELNGNNASTGYRRMVLTTSTPVRAQSLLRFAAGSPAIPVHTEAVLIMPSVINVIPRKIYSRSNRN
ncbi:MAG: hypothetical protein NVSMB9_27880 [Isosphaeraceae bacterium]